MPDQCDACGNAIVRSEGVPFAVDTLAVTVPTEDAETYEERSFRLCSECQRRIVDWIDDCPEDATRADMVSLETAERTLSEHADRLQNLAGDLGDLARGDTDA